MKSEAFYMDAQTYADLSVFHLDKHSFSLYGFLKKTKTIGGADRLSEMMRNPTNDIELLRSRSGAIREFMNLKIDLDISHDQFDLILHYLKFEKGHIRGNLFDSCRAYIANQLRESASYYRVLIGLKRLLSLFKYSFELAPILEQSDSDHLRKMGGKLKGIIELNDLDNLKSLCTKKRLSFYDIGNLDSTIRRRNGLLIIDLLHIYYELDVLECLSKLAGQRGFCIAEYIEEDSATVQLKGMFYPGISAAIANDIEFSPGEHCVLLTGSNMAGKSSFLRSLASATYLAHLGFPVCASSMRTSVLNGLVTTINLGDSLDSGLSHYLNEVMRVRKVAEILNRQNKMVVLFDELFRGTNPDDALHASEMVIEGFSKVKDSFFVISSHLSKLGAGGTSTNVSFKQMEHVWDTDKPRFTYKIKSGVSKDGVGMYFIRRENIEALLQQASIRGLA